MSLRQDIPIVETQPVGVLTITEVARRGGQSRSLLKKLSAQRNGQLGGRPRKAKIIPRDIPYTSVFINSRKWNTFSPQELADYKEDCFHYWRQAGFPFYKLSSDEKQKHYQTMLRYPYAGLLRDGVIYQTMHGLSVAWSYHPHAWSVQCNGKPSPIDNFKHDDRLREVINKIITEYPNMSESKMRKVLRVYSGSQSVSNFRPTAAAVLYNTFCPEGGTVWDMSTGYGGRLLGALICPKVRRYIGSDPCTASTYGNQQMAHEMNHRDMAVELYNVPAECYLPDPQSIDFAFTSTPYGGTEHYSNEQNQSYIKFPSSGIWMDGFMRRVLANVAYGLKPNGVLAINLADVKTHPTLTEDFLKMAKEDGWELIETLQLALSPMPGIRKPGQKYKHEPIFVLKRR